MSNDYYNHTSRFSRHTLGRAESINAAFDALEAGLDKLPSAARLTNGTTMFAVASGSANALVVSMPKTMTAYSNGATIWVEVGTTNTGAATINVDGLGARSIRLPSGANIAAGDLTAGDIVQLAFDQSANVWKIVTPYRSLLAEASAAISASAASAAAAATSESNAADSETAAATSETNAAASAAAASTSESNASDSETAAATSETNAAASANAASTSETNAADSEAAAATSEANAAASASAAATSETNAAASASAAADSETAAAASATAAAATKTAIDTVYLGAKASDPATDNDGGALVVGTWYFNTSSDAPRIYTASGWADAVFDTTGLVAEPNIQTFTSSGTWTKPAGATVVMVEAVGGGGGGANQTGITGVGGGAGGSYVCIRLEDGDVGATETVTIGSGGTGGASGSATSGTAGGDTTFGSHVTAKGGNPATSTAFRAGTLGGAVEVTWATDGWAKDMVFPFGSPGGNSLYPSGSTVMGGGAGGGGSNAGTQSQYHGDGGDGSDAAGVKAGDGATPGGGGGGSRNDGGGGDGGDGWCRVTSW